MPDVPAASGWTDWTQIGCGPNLIQKPAGQCRRLLRTLYDVFRQGDYANTTLNLSEWAKKIAILQGHYLTALVLKDEHALVREDLISGYRDATVEAFNQYVNENFARLTDLGMAFCKNIETYQ